MGASASVLGGDDAAQMAQFQALRAAYEAKRGEELTDEAMLEHLKAAVPAPPAAAASGARLIIAGPPAGGKGTQCEFIREHYRNVHLSTGDMLRAAVEAGSAVGQAAKQHMDNGELVPDEVIIGVIKERLAAEDCAAQGWLLDGFPRSAEQASALAGADGVQAPHLVVLLEVPDEVIVSRVTGRRSDPETGKIYHLEFNPPENEEVAARLVQRSDDTVEKVQTRLQTYRDNLAAIETTLKAVFGDNIIFRVDANRAADAIWEDIKAAVDAITASGSGASAEGEASGSGSASAEGEAAAEGSAEAEAAAPAEAEAAAAE